MNAIIRGIFEILTYRERKKERGENFKRLPAELKNFLSPLGRKLPETFCEKSSCLFSPHKTHQEADRGRRGDPGERGDIGEKVSVEFIRKC